ncbi:MAG: helix-turn-helix domain-containing protein [Pseudomonadota bacterium]
MLSRDFLCVGDVASLLKVTEATVRNWIHAGDLSAIDVGREWRIAPRDLEAFLETRRSTKLKHSASAGGR